MIYRKITRINFFPQLSHSALRVVVAVKVVAGPGPERESCGQLWGHQLRRDPTPAPRQPTGTAPALPLATGKLQIFPITLPQTWPGTSTFNVLPEVILSTCHCLRLDHCQSRIINIPSCSFITAWTRRSGAQEATSSSTMTEYNLQ